jgi:hypothetical protein
MRRDPEKSIRLLSTEDNKSRISRAREDRLYQRDEDATKSCKKAHFK